MPIVMNFLIEFSYSMFPIVIDTSIRVFNELFSSIHTPGRLYRYNLVFLFHTTSSIVYLVYNSF